MTTKTDPYAPLKERAWREVADVDARLAAGEIDEATWFAEMSQAQADRLIVGVFNEQIHERPTEELIASWGYKIAGRSERTNLRKPQIDYRVMWVDNTSRPSAISEEGS